MTAGELIEEQRKRTPPLESRLSDIKNQGGEEKLTKPLKKSDQSYRMKISEKRQ